jgi:hypothetical protein
LARNFSINFSVSSIFFGLIFLFCCFSNFMRSSKY